MRATGISFRTASAGDLPALLSLQARAVAAGYPEPLRSRLLDNPHIIKQDLTARWETGQLFAVAEQNEAPVGFAVATLGQDGEAELGALFVEPSLWRKGIGTALTTFLDGHLLERGMRRIFVYANPLFMAFYTAAGFVSSGSTDMPNFGPVPVFSKTL